jgi:eukaryotic-like serine/threonine-protein kinase
MNTYNDSGCYSSKRHGYIVTSIILVSIFLFTAGPMSSSAQNSLPSPSAMNQSSSSQPTGFSGIPLITSGGPGQETASGPQQLQYSLYENPQHNFTIQYPSDWTLRQGGGAGVIVTFSSPYESDFDPFIANLVIGIENLTSGASLENYTSSVVALLQSIPAGGDFSLTGSPLATTFGGFPARKTGFTITVPNERSLSSETNVEGVQLWTVDNNTAYVLSFAAEQDKFASYLPTVEHIIDTFRITRAG